MEMNCFEVHYIDWDGTQTYATYRAEDELHAQEKFELFHPRVEILEIVDKGLA